jgi:hypothetical protein
MSEQVMAAEAAVRAFEDENVHCGDRSYQDALERRERLISEDDMISVGELVKLLTR